MEAIEAAIFALENPSKELIIQEHMTRINGQVARLRQLCHEWLKEDKEE